MKAVRLVTHLPPSIWMPDAGTFDDATQRPSQFSLMREPQQPVAKTEQPEEAYFMILEKKLSDLSH